MKINFIRLQNFRNIEFANILLESNSVWIRGDNAQGKTNLLEAIGLLSTLRSFRTAKNAAMIKRGEKEAKILMSVNCEKSGESEVEISLSDKRKVFIDGEEIKYSEFIGKYALVAATNEDIAIVRGAPEVRRRECDMFISSLDSEYLEQLKRFHNALDRRNALLRQDCQDSAAFDAFEFQMSQSAAKISDARSRFLDMIAERASGFYAELANENGDRAKLRLRPNCDYSDAAAYAHILSENRNDDLRRQSTSNGPHRDDFNFEVNSMNAKLYASEGQQRSLALSFRLAQFEIIKSEKKSEPVLLCDDVLAELDSKRSAAFWRCASPSAQIIASATSFAPQNSQNGRQWKTINAVEAKFFDADGKFAEQ